MLTHWTQRAIELWEPSHEALMESILGNDVLTMDETPIKAGHKAKGKMKTGQADGRGFESRRPLQFRFLSGKSIQPVPSPLFSGRVRAASFTHELRQLRHM